MKKAKWFPQRDVGPVVVPWIMAVVVVFVLLLPQPLVCTFCSRLCYAMLCYRCMVSKDETLFTMPRVRLVNFKAYNNGETAKV